MLMFDPKVAYQMLIFESSDLHEGEAVLTSWSCAVNASLRKKYLKKKFQFLIRKEF